MSATATPTSRPPPALWRRLILRPPTTRWMATYNAIFILGALSVALACRTFAWLTAAWLLFLGVESWVLLEYLAHRWIFHHVLSKDHGRHHDHPKEERYTHGPTFVVFLTWSTALVLYSLLFGWRMGLFALVGLNTMYVGYELLHRLVHTPVGARWRWLRPTRAWHAAHHYDNEQRGYGVTSPFWDWVFRTGSVRARFPGWLLWAIPLPLPMVHFLVAGAVPSAVKPGTSIPPPPRWAMGEE